jgi:hypothetical protein
MSQREFSERGAARAQIRELPRPFTVARFFHNPNTKSALTVCLLSRMWDIPGRKVSPSSWAGRRKARGFFVASATHSCAVDQWGRNSALMSWTHEAIAGCIIVLRMSASPSQRSVSNCDGSVSGSARENHCMIVLTSLCDVTRSADGA